MAEFTGERVVPGEVDADLWNEHFARYAFAARLARRKRVLDAGCGTGYGSAELARSASHVVGVDLSPEAIRYARLHYAIPDVHFLTGSCTALPIASGSQDLVVAFEVLEHLVDWAAFLAETRRVLAPGGQCVISTPNKDYYTESRGTGGVNPFHVHEFSYQEFRDALRGVFPHVSLFLQNRTDGFIFQPVKIFSPAEARVESGAGSPEEAHFFIAVCALAPQTGAPTFFFLPRAANLLREREQHIGRLTSEVNAKEQSIAQLAADREKLIEMFRLQKEDLEERNQWAERLNRELSEGAAVIRRLQSELAEQAGGYEAKIAQLQREQEAQASGYEDKIRELQAEAAAHASGYEEKIRALEQELDQRTAWAVETEQKLQRELQEKCQELAACVEALHATEKTLGERTDWALSLNKRIEELEASLAALRSSRWMKVGSALGIGPRLQGE